MTKEETAAKELIDKFRKEMFSPHSCEFCLECNGVPCKAKDKGAKRCALILADTLIEVTGNVDKLVNQLIVLLPAADRKWITSESNSITYWLKIKEAINKA